MNSSLSPINPSPTTPERSHQQEGYLTPERHTQQEGRLTPERNVNLSPTKSLTKSPSLNNLKPQGIKQQNNLIDELKKENFNLKLRIYYLQIELDASGNDETVKLKTEKEIIQKEMNELILRTNSINELFNRLSCIIQTSEGMDGFTIEQLPIIIEKQQEHNDCLVEEVSLLNEKITELNDYGQDILEKYNKTKETVNNLEKKLEEIEKTHTEETEKYCTLSQVIYYLNIRNKKNRFFN